MTSAILLFMISLYDLLDAANGQLFGEAAARLFTGFCLDIHFIRPDEIFVARRTERGDTHQHMQEAIARGATGLLCTNPPDFDTEGITVVIVKDTEASLLSWASYALSKFKPTVIAVTGSSGKTVTAEAICRVLGTRFSVFNGAQDDYYFSDSRLGLAVALAHLSPEQKMVVLSLEARQVGEMEVLVQIVQPKIGVVTHVGYGGMAAFENVDQSTHEASVLVEHLPGDGLAVLNYDRDEVRDMASCTPARTLTVAMSNFGADLMAYNIVAGLTQTGFDLRQGAERYVGRWTPLLGKHQLYSVLAALAVGQFCDVPLDGGLKAITNMESLPGRMNSLVGINGCVLVDDTYDATPQSTHYALEWLQSHRGSGIRTVFVMGDMDRLGEHSRHGHRLVGQQAAEACDIVVTQGAEASLSGRAAIDYGMTPGSVHITYSATDAIQWVRELLRPTPNDVILVKGGRSSRMENVVRELLNIDGDQSRLVRQGAVWQSISHGQPMYTTWVEIDQKAIAHNVRLLKAMVGEDVTIMAVVKADGYGHGAVGTGITALANGAKALAVASLDEALELRNAGIEAPVLVLSYTPVAAVRQALRRNITLTLYDMDLAYLYNQVARAEGQALTVHVKIDTGMGRMGVLANEAIPFFRQLMKLDYLNVEGVFTHFSMSDEDLDYTAQQLHNFKMVVNPLRANGFDFKYVHASNSAAILTMPDAYFNLVRPGIALYGQSPSETVPIPLEFKPAITWKTVVAQVKALPPGSPVGYGQTYYTEEHEQIAVIPVGYSHGFRRKPQHWQQVLVRGQFAPIVGRVSMEKTTINVTHIPDVTIGDEVVLLGKQGEAEITPYAVAEQLGTNNYEVITTILARMPRH